MFLTSTAYAMGAAPQQGVVEGPLGMLQGPVVPMVLMFVVFYFLLIRPQQKKAKAHREMIAALKAGDRVMTAGGLYGRIVKIDDEKAVVDLGDSKVTIGRGYITGLSAAGPVSTSANSQKKNSKGEEKKSTEVDSSDNTEGDSK